jgi:hypothetical protein
MRFGIGLKVVARIEHGLQVGTDWWDFIFIVLFNPQ